MSKLSSWDELKTHRENTKADTSMFSDKIVLAVGEATCGIAAGAKNIAATLESEMKKAGVSNAQIIPTGCYGCCYAEPMVEVRIPGEQPVYYGYVDEDTAKDIVNKHLVKGEKLTDHILNVEVSVP